ncbi:MAG: anthranilate phosphoribosyltransferase [Deltaproteobacteria bacterium]|nr:MAG: anthranilate phosphoribosyltransferase [Deltaproteobacteria bacterium]
MTQAYVQAMSCLLHDDPLPPATASALVHAMMRGELPPSQTAAILTGLAARGVTDEELAAMALAMRAHMVPVRAEGPLIDTCGTGGSGLSTANTSTMAAFVVAGAGGRVAKHGNRASSGTCGSSDLLEAAGLRLQVPPERASELLDAVGLAFLFAPAYHPAVRHVGLVRKELGFRTVFNLLGPLCNPAGATLQVIGVSDAAAAPLIARALARLGSERVMVVRGEDGLDEITLTGPTRTWTLLGGEIVEGEIVPESLGLARCDPEELRGGDVTTNLRIFHEVLQGMTESPHARLVLLNAAAALHTAGLAADLREGLSAATESLRGGHARRVFERYHERAGSPP